MPADDPTRQLSEFLDREIRKAVRLQDCLEKFGKHWEGDITGGHGTTASVNDTLPKPVDSIDDFLSHDWATKGWKKFITLCLVYNSIPAAVFAIIFSGTFGILEIFFQPLRRMKGPVLWIAGKPWQTEDAGYFGLGMGMLAFIVVLFFWQRIKVLFCQSSRMVFMDKLCIHQTDARLKAKGILGLAGFLRISSHLVVLWSPRYFTRLWCVYEIASWLSQKKPLRNVEISPVAQGMFITCLIFGMTILTIAMVWLARLESTTYNAVLGATVFAICLLPVHIIRRLVADLRKMPQQVSNFKFENAECFCCSVNHKLKIGEETVELPCDRDVISEKLQQWFGREVTEGQTPEDLFSSYVREKFGSSVCERVGGSRIAYVSALIATLPGWLFITDRFHLLWEVDGIVAWRLFFHYLATTFAVFPSIIRFSLYVAEFLDVRIGVPSNILLDILATILAVCMTALPTLLVLFALIQTLGMEAMWPQVIVLSAATVLAMILFSKDLIAWIRMLRSCCVGKTGEGAGHKDGSSNGPGEEEEEKEEEKEEKEEIVSI